MLDEFGQEPGFTLTEVAAGNGAAKASP